MDDYDLIAIGFEPTDATEQQIADAWRERGYALTEVQDVNFEGDGMANVETPPGAVWDEMMRHGGDEWTASNGVTIIVETP